MTFRSKLAARSGGCFFVLLTTAFACAVILVNGLILSGFYAPIESFTWDLVGRDRFQQDHSKERFVHFVTSSVMYLGPVFLLVLQWWFLDLFLDITGRKPNEDGGEAST